MSVTWPPKVSLHTPPTPHSPDRMPQTPGRYNRGVALPSDLAGHTATHRSCMATGHPALRQASRIFFCWRIFHLSISPIGDWKRKRENMLGESEHTSSDPSPRLTHRNSLRDTDIRRARSCSAANLWHCFQSGASVVQGGSECGLICSADRNRV